MSAFLNTLLTTSHVYHIFTKNNLKVHLSKNKNSRTEDYQEAAFKYVMAFSIIALLQYQWALWCLNGWMVLIQHQSQLAML